MLSPKRVKWRKVQKGNLKGKASRGNALQYGDFGLQATSPGLITSRQLEAARIAMTRFTKRGGKTWIRIFPDKPVTKKPAEVRMGSGKGGLDHWAAVIQPGRVIFEMEGVPKDIAIEAMRLANHKLPVKTRTLVREGK